MAEQDRQEMLLLNCFAQFYEEVARIKQAAILGSLPDYLAAGGKVPVQPDEMARAVSIRLIDLLNGQRKDMHHHATETQLRAYAMASYVMAVLADEIFILELVWPAQDAWLQVLLEYRLFNSRRAGRKFFEMAGQVLASGSRTGVQRDLAACFLLALQLGFKGMHRGGQGAASLDALRQRLHRFVNGSSLPLSDERLFAQAYEHTVRTSLDERIAPIKPWFRLIRRAAFGFVLVSSGLWFWLIQPLIRAGAG
jgi:type VI secretion system protein ImpK